MVGSAGSSVCGGEGRGAYCAHGPTGASQLPLCRPNSPTAHAASATPPPLPLFPPLDAHRLADERERHSEQQVDASNDGEADPAVARLLVVHAKRSGIGHEEEQQAGDHPVVRPVVLDVGGVGGGDILVPQQRQRHHTKHDQGAGRHLCEGQGEEGDAFNWERQPQTQKWRPTASCAQVCPPPHTHTQTHTATQALPAPG